MNEMVLVSATDSVASLCFLIIHDQQLTSICHMNRSFACHPCVCVCVCVCVIIAAAARA